MKKLIVAVIAVWALVLAGGVGIGVVVLADSDDDADTTQESATPSPSESGSATPPADAEELLDRLYEQQISWSPCGKNECGTLEVPVDYTDPSAGTTRIQLERSLATGDRVGSLVVNPGGPGAPGTDTVEQKGSYFQRELIERFDIVGFDPRGVGESNPIDCLSDAELDEYIAEDPDPDNAQEAQEYEDTQEDYWEGCVENSDELVGHISTVEVARDMDILRAALGEEKLPYLGFSYGTLLGATYADLFPENVGRFVLDGAVDPSLPAVEDLKSQAGGFERALRSYLQNCVDGGDCFLGDSVEDGLATITGLLEEIEQEPLPTDQERDLEIGNAFYGLVLPLYSEDLWTWLDQGLADALEGDGSVLLFLADYYGSREDGTYTDNSLEAITVVNCLDDPTSLPAEEIPELYPEFEEASPTFGRVFAWSLIACHGMPFEPAEEFPEIDAPGAAPIVVIGTTRDPATPYEEAIAMAEQLESGVFVSRDGDGHTAYNSGNSCIDDAVHGYLIDGTVPDDGLEC